MISDKFSEKISQDWLWRERELRDVDSALQKLSINSDFAIKSCILILYSHWEGHFKFSATELLSYISEGINRKLFHWTDIKDDVRYRLLFCNYRLSNIKEQTQETFISYLNALSNKRYSDIVSAKDEIIMVDDNLNSTRAEAICKNLGVDHTWCSLKRIIIDDRFLQYRNAIAHGSKRLRSGDEMDLKDATVTDALNEMRALIREAKNKFQNAIDRREFLS